MEFLKKHCLSIITIAAWFLFIIFALLKVYEGVSISFFIGIIFVVILIVKNTKKKKAAAAPLRNVPAAATHHLPSSISQEGKRYDLAYHYENVDIVGRTYHDDIKLIENETLFILQEPENEADPHAVSVNVNRNGLTALVGYIAKDNRLKRMVNDYYGRGDLVIAYVDNAAFDTMTIGFYK